jgi:diaminohydroxyphosphoribosylaminopyrimidine deaminase/5-amino-6-(5-phosphoribosylamino)uracil reductase
MAYALRLARKGLFTTTPNPRVGCVLVKDQSIVGEGWHARSGEAHAEINALAMAGDKARGATAYVTLEPCRHFGRTPPCVQALLAAGITRVVTAMEDPNPQVAGQGLVQLRNTGIAVECGVMETEARALNPGFITRMTQGRPFVRCKLAMSLDGRTAMASGESQWITGAAAREDVQRLRARSCAIMTGVGTILADDPSLNVRLPGEMPRQPLRVILDPELETPPDARTLWLDGDTLIFTGLTKTPAFKPLQATGAEIQTLPRRGRGLDLEFALEELARREINEVHLECGATLAGAMLAAGLVDELVIYMAPRVMGDGARGLFHLPGLTRMAEAIPMEIVDIRAVGQDWRITTRGVNSP